MTKVIEKVGTTKKNKLAWVIGQEIRKQVDEPMSRTDKTTTNLYCYLTSIVDAYLHEDDEAYHIVLKQPLHEGEPSIFDFRRARLKELVTEIKARWPKNCTWTDESSLQVVKISTADCTVYYDRDTYLSNGNRQAPTEPYVNFNKSKRASTPRKTITMEIEL